MKTILSLILLTVPAWCNQGLNTTSASAAGVITVPAVAPFNTGAEQLLPLVFEVRLQNWQAAPDSSHRIGIFYGFGFGLEIWETGEITAVDAIDDLSAYTNRASFNATGHSDVTIRVTRDPVNGLFGIRGFDTATKALIGGICGYIGFGTGHTDCPMTPHLTNISGTGALWSTPGGTSPTNTGLLAYFKVRGALASDPTTIPGEFTSADIGDWHFEGNLTNIATGSYGVSLTYPSPTYSTTTPYAPVCSAGTGQSVRAGSVITMSGASSSANDGNGSLTYMWQQTSGPSTVAWPLGHHVVAPTIKNLIAGGYQFQLIVADSLGATSSCTVGHGTVATDSNSVVVTENTTLEHLLQPLMMTGHTVWPWTDVVIPQSADNMIALETSSYYPFWRTTSTNGTISVPPVTTSAEITRNIGVSVVGTGTHFKADFCGGGNDQDADSPRLIIQYINDQGEREYRPFGVGRKDRGGGVLFTVSSASSSTVFTLNSGSGAYLYVGEPIHVGARNGVISGIAGDVITTSSLGGTPSPGDSVYVDACTDDTHMHVFGETFMFSTTQSGLSYGRMNENQMAAWTSQNNTANANYYDSVLGFYALYYETGLPKYLTAAQNLADMWWESPAILNGESCWEGPFPGYGGSGAWCPPPRGQAYMGLYLRARERPSMWTGMVKHLDSLSTASTSGAVIDLREESARMAIVCTGAMFIQELSVTATNLAAYKTFCADTVNNKWAANVRGDGSVYSPQYGYGSSNSDGDFFDVELTPGTKIVTPTGGAFNCGRIATGTGSGATRLWAYFPNSITGQFSGGDPVTYAIDTCASNQLTLHVNYAGSTHRTSYGIGLNQIGGTFVQPFMMGYWMHSLALASQALTVFGGSTNLTTAATARTMITNGGSWLLSTGYRPATGGLFYVRGGLTNDGAVGNANGNGGCEPDPETANTNGYACTDNGDHGTQSSRYTAGEIMGALSYAYSYSPNPTLKTNIDNWYGLLWGGLGGPGADANYLSGYYPVTIVKAKDYAFSFGWGADYLWPAARIGGVAAAAPRTYQIPFRLANFSTAAKVRVTITNASGASSATVCTSSPCSITPDARQGAMALYKIEYLTSGNALISAGDALPLTLQP